MVLRDQRQRSLVPFEHAHHGVVATEQAVWYLNKKPRPVAAFAVGVETAAVCEPRQRSGPELNGFVAQVGRGHEAHAAGGACAGQVPRPCKACLTASGGH